MNNRFIFLILYLCINSIININIIHAKTLPLLVQLENIDETYDGTRIAVFGWVRSVEVKHGRLGSLYNELILGSSTEHITVYYLLPVYNLEDKYVIVQGIYTEEGRFGGLLADKFIVADTIEIDWIGTNN